jgi:hypothetical protein
MSFSWKLVGVTLLRPATLPWAITSAPRTLKERRALITKINKQISHLTDERTLVEQEKIGDQDRTALYELLVADLRNFTGYLRPELRPTRQVF